MKKRVFSGIKPSGSPQLGNYLGAIRRWAAEQDQYDNIFCVVDLHAITVYVPPEELKQNIREVAGILVASGIDPERSILFMQSHVPEHSELAWLLNCYVPMGWMQRMTQYKEKVQSQNAESISVGVFDYPALMAADILLYDTHAVPVGDDQKQHVELARDVAQRFNSLYGETFVVPEPTIAEVGARIMGLEDPTKKMSKSEGNGGQSIDMLDGPDVIRKKIMRATTDSQREIVFDEARPGIFNLLTIYQTITGEPRQEIEARFEGKGYGDFKKVLAEAVVECLRPVQERYAEITAEPGHLDKVLKAGAARAHPIAAETLNRVQRKIGLA
jgi:tryptophanyl-tRNA synthetase